MTHAGNERRYALMRTGHGEKRSRQRESAIAALLSFPTVIEAAKFCNLHPSTLRRWLKEPEFDADFCRAKERTLQLAQEHLQRGTLSAVNVLLSIANDKKATSASRVTAARCILESTGLIKGQNAVTVNNVIPPTIEGVDEALAEAMRDPATRAWMRVLIEKMDTEAMN